jgi:lipoprotein-anchoring transpeptidase ErfK/SrfK
MRRICLSLLSMLLLVSCASDQRAASGRSASLTQPGNTPKADVSYWNGDGMNEPARIKINLGEQRAYFFKGDQVVGIAPVSTGRAGYRTPAGRFAVLDKNIDHISSLYGNFVDENGNVMEKDVGVRTHRRPPGTYFSGAPMPYFIRFYGGIGMHAGYLPGYPASHGCVRLPKHMAGHFFHNVQPGTPVHVVN